MSITSKARRDAKRRQEKRQENQAAAKASPIEPHAELRDQARKLLAGVVRRDGQWVLGMDGRIAGESDSAARVLALLMQAAELHERQGTPVRLVYSDALKDAAHAEARSEGLDFEQYKARLAGAPVAAAAVEGDAAA